MTMRLKKSVLITSLCTSLLTLGACQTISEDACRAGNWEDIGFNDGSQGRSRSRLAAIGEECAKYGIQPDHSAYIAGLEAGLRRFCTPDQGFRDGENGNRANEECSALGFDTYLDGHADGYDIYVVRRDYSDLQERWTDIEARILETEAELDRPDLDRSERRDVRAKLRELENERDDIRSDIRQIEREYDWPRWRPDLIEDNDGA